MFAGYRHCKKCGKALMGLFDGALCEECEKEENSRMTNEEAIAYFKRHIDLYCVDGICREAEEMAIKALEQTTWIPVSERLPEERDWYLAVFKEIDAGYQLIPRVADYIGNGENEWQIIDEDGVGGVYRFVLECVAWMPLPKPYEPQESEDKE